MAKVNVNCLRRELYGDRYNREFSGIGLSGILKTSYLNALARLPNTEVRSDTLFDSDRAWRS